MFKSYPTGKSDIGTYTYPAAGHAQPHGVQSIAPSGGGTALSFVYDSVGKMTTDALTQNGFTYLPYRLPLTVAHTGGDTITMQYDADHNRVARAITGGVLIADNRTDFALSAIIKYAILSF